MGDITWEDNDTPFSQRFGDPYFSRSDGRAETQHVFVAGNGLPRRWQGRESFTIGELGFGTGLNLLETAITWAQSAPPTAKLSYVAFEQFPMAKTDLLRAVRRWEALAALARELAEYWPPPEGWSTLAVGPAELRLAIGDANAMLPAWEGRADAWYLDGFSPAKNPELWGKELMQAVAARTAPGGTFATYTAAGWVRRNLVAAGFTVEKAAGFGRKRECLRGELSAARDSTAGAI